MELTQLTETEVSHFIDKGYLILKNCFDMSEGSIAARWVEESWLRNGIEKNDVANWPKEKIHMPSIEWVKLSKFSPKVYNAISDLVGGANKLYGDGEIVWSNAFIANYGFGRDQEWEEPNPRVEDWHVDGDFYLHFLDSPEIALLIAVYFTDVEHQGGGTFIVEDSVKAVSEFLLDRPEGSRDFEIKEANLTDQCSKFKELCINAGDVVLMHPFMIHASSFNHTDNVRLMINPGCSLNAPLNLNRNNYDDYTPTEKCILKSLGVKNIEYQITNSRREFDCSRFESQIKLAELEASRMGKNKKQYTKNLFIPGDFIG